MSLTPAPAPAVTSTDDRAFPTLNAIRAVGAIMVVTTHVGFDTGRIMDGWTGAVIGRMDFGVTLFFVLSGFLLSRPFFLATARRQPLPDLGHYWWKRGLRILPLYWIVVVAAMLLIPANRDLDWTVWVQQLTFTQLYTPDLLPMGLTQMWSLATEVAFYVLLPVIIWGLTRRRKRGLNLPSVARRLGILCVLAVSWTAYFASVPGSEGHYLQWLPGYLLWFAVGIWYAAVSASQAADGRVSVLDRWGSDLVGCWTLATAAFAIACTPIAGPLDLTSTQPWTAVFKSVLYAVSAGFYLLPLVFGPEREGRVRTVLANRTFSWLGEVSYGIFCIHLLMVQLSFTMFDVQIFTGNFSTIWTSTMLGTLALSALALRYVEQPALGFKNRGWFAARARQRRAASTRS